jgi:hypothetical protein
LLIGKGYGFVEWVLAVNCNNKLVSRFQTSRAGTKAEAEAGAGAKDEAEAMWQDEAIATAIAESKSASFEEFYGKFRSYKPATEPQSKRQVQPRAKSADAFVGDVLEQLAEKQAAIHAQIKGRMHCPR